MEDLEKGNRESDIYTVFLKDQTQNYRDKTSKKRQVIDFLAGMTDEYFLGKIKK